MLELGNFQPSIRFLMKNTLHSGKYKNTILVQYAAVTNQLQLGFVPLHALQQIVGRLIGTA
jgi:hypothetical protein